MKYLRKFLKENATLGSVSAGDVAGFRSSLFSKPIKREKAQKPVDNVPQIKFQNDARSLRGSMLYKILKEYEEGRFNASDIISRLKAAEKKFDYEKNSTVFGIEDDEGNIIKVYVKSDQSDRFEKTLAELLNNVDDAKEIPEILFELKDKFDIIHVEWGKIQEDEEQTQLPQKDSTEQHSVDDVENMDDDKEDSDESQNDDELEKLDNFGDEKSEEQSVLDKVIAMLKADAEARTAEAKAKEAEAKAKEAEFAAKAAEIKIKGEQEVLDMEAYFRKQEEEKKEAQRLAKLARFRHEKASEIQTENVKQTLKKFGEKK